MEIKKFSMEYYDEIIQIWKRSGISVGSSDTKEEIKKVLKRNPDLFLIGKINDKIISVVIGAFDGRRGYVHHLAVLPEYQKKGYGKLIMEDLCERFRKMEVHKVHLFIEKYNNKVVRFYKRLGWEIRDDLTMMSHVPDISKYQKEI